mmetsp:Transcript_20018/g.60496  ORF Transcript_20018/g.60496 Transcript_20018/m.60496 type:complete len:280 (-) Transcript_20018:490-1329(-)
MWQVFLTKNTRISSCAQSPWTVEVYRRMLSAWTCAPAWQPIMRWQSRIVSSCWKGKWLGSQQPASTLWCRTRCLWRALPHTGRGCLRWSAAISRGTLCTPSTWRSAAASSTDRWSSRSPKILHGQLCCGCQATAPCPPLQRLRMCRWLPARLVKALPRCGRVWVLACIRSWCCSCTGGSQPAPGGCASLHCRPTGGVWHVLAASHLGMRTSLQISPWRPQMHIPQIWLLQQMWCSGKLGMARPASACPPTRRWCTCGDSTSTRSPSCGASCSSTAPPSK